MAPARQSLRLPNVSGKGTHEVVFYDWGDPTAPDVAICVHGLSRNARDFDILAAALAQRGWRVLAINMAGRGMSDWLDDPFEYHYGTYVADCLAVMDNFHLRGVDWIGTSMGGIIGLAIAANHPTRIRRLVLNDIGTFLPASALARIYDYLSAMPKNFSSHAAAETFLREIMAPFGITDPQIWQHVMQHGIIEKNGGWCLACDPAIIDPIRRDTQDFANVEDISLAHLWEKIDIPTLIIRGAQSDLLDAETVSAMRATNPKAETITIEGVGHAPALASEDQVRLVVNWLAGGGALQGL